MNAIKPLKKRQSLALLQTVKGVSLTQVCDEALMKKASVLSEGLVDEGDGSTGTEQIYRGSTLVTIELQREEFDFICDEPGVSMLAEAVRNSVMVRLRLMRLARMEAERKVAPRLVRGMTSQTEFKVDGTKLLVDIDVECPLACALEETGSLEGGER